MIPCEELSQVDYIPTIPQFITWIGNKWGDLPALSDTLNTYSYSQLCTRLARRRAYLYSLGLAKGAKVAIWEKTSIDAVETFLAATSAGFIAIIIPASLNEQAVVSCCTQFNIDVLAIRDEYADLVHDAPFMVIPSSIMSEQEAPVAQVSKDDPAAIFFTGGTTGTPKGAVLPHRALMRGAFNGIFSPGRQLGYHRIICLLPLSHVFGLIRSTLSALYTGSLWYSAEDTKATISKIPLIKPTVLVLVPGLCDILYGLTKLYGVQFLGGELKTIISGAANVPPRLIQAFDDIGINLLAGYGMTEGANFTTGNKDVKTHPTSVGKVYPEQQVKIVDGEIWIKGDNLFLEYYNQPEETAKVLTEDGWLKTGDLGRFDQDDYLYITGRIKNLIILSNGENISPEEIETPFYKCNALKDCLVSEKEIDGEKLIAIDIYPQMAAFEGKPWEEVECFFKSLVEDVNNTLPTTHRIHNITVRKEDFKRTGALKVARNQE